MMSQLAGFPRSLAARLVLAAAIWSVLILALGGFLLVQQYRASAFRSLDGDLDNTLVTLIAAAQIDETGAVALSQTPNDPRFKAGDSGRYWAIAPVSDTPEPKVTARSESLWDEGVAWPNGSSQALSALNGEILRVDMVGPFNQPVRVAAMAVTLPGDARLIMFMAMADRRPVLRDAGRFTQTLVLALAVLALGLLAMVLVQVGVGLAPLNRLQGDVAQIRAGRMKRLEGAYPTEVAPLTEELNALIAHNQDVVERARTHVGNLAHALKTPISVLLNEARASQGPFAALVARQAEAMSRNVQHYLERAQAAARAETLGARTECAPVIEDIARTLTRLFGRDRDLDMDLALDGGLAFRGERQDLEEMVGNLMENACKYGEGAVRVSARVADALSLEIMVEDDGPGLTPEQQETALKRGERLDETAPGAGLGLAIVADLAMLYGGALTMGRSDLGGLSARLLLPRVD
jgi:signal transduction histidine kinase